MPQFDPNRAPSDAKLRELILFISQRSEYDEKFGAVKLNKLLFFADFLAYVKLGRSITGQEYQKLPKGPAPRRLIPVMRQMEKDKVVAMAKRVYRGFTQKVSVPLREADLSDFTADEIAVVTDVLETLWRKNARGVSNLSHEFQGWRLAADGETIPYQMALVRFAKPRKRDIQKIIAMKEEITALRKEFSSDDD